MEREFTTIYIKKTYNLNFSKLKLDFSIYIWKEEDWLLLLLLIKGAETEEEENTFFIIISSSSSTFSE